ncbi:MAG: DnaJ C-terminal domain-containing protein [Rhodothermales bacterium]
MAKAKDYYKILGISEKASPEEIKKSYRALARQYHPDRNPDQPDAEERFKSIQEAYDTLSDPQRRREYNQFKKDPFAPFQTANGDQFYRAPDGTFVRRDRQKGPTANTQDIFDLGDDNGGFSGFINRIFGSEGEPKRPAEKSRSRRSSLDIDTRVRLNFMQALRGGKTELTLPHGETIRIKIPRGVQPGFKIKLKGRGQVGTTSAGDLYVTFEVEPHNYYRRRGDDLHITCSINPLEAIVGISRNVINAYGNRIKVKIPAGTQHGTKLRLKGQGVETRKKTGDLYVQIELHTPENLTDDQLSILKKAGKDTKLL